MIKKKKILFIAGNARSLIANRINLINELKNNNCIVEAAVPIEDLLDEVYEIGIKIYTFRLNRGSINPIKCMEAFLDLFKIAYKFKPDIVFTYTVGPIVWGNLCSFLVGVPKIFSMITGLGSSFNESKKIKDRFLKSIIINLYRLSINFCTKVYFQNNDDLNEFIIRKIFFDKSKAIRVKGSGIDLNKFYPHPLPEEIKFIFVGRLLKEKGVYEFFEAAKIIHKKYKNIKFLIVGPFDPSLKNCIDKVLFEEIKTSKEVEYLGKVKDVRPFLRESSVFVLPSYYREGVPKSSLEAMAIGRPIITCDSIGCRETVLENKNGFLVNPKNIKSLSLKMKLFIDKPELIQTMSLESINFSKTFDVKDVNRKIINSMKII